MEDLEQYKSLVKGNIEELINKNDIVEAKEIIKEYEKIVSKDVDIYSFKAVITMMEGNNYDAENILKEGLTIYPTSFDLMYNLAYLYQSMNKNDIAINYYKKSIINSKNENEETVAYNALTYLGIKESKNDLISNIMSEAYYENAIQFDNMGNKSDAALYYGLAYKYSKDQELKSKLYNLFNNNKVLRDIFNIAAISDKKRFIILSSCGWVDIYQRMHHISRALSKFGNEVIYVTPAIPVDVNTESITFDALNEYSIKNEKIIDGVKIYSPVAALYNEKGIADNYISLLQSLLDKVTDANKTVIVTYMPYQVEAISALRGSFIHIYDCVDDHSDIDYAFWGNKKDVVWEQELMDRADAITTTAISLYLQKAAVEGRKNVYLSRNAVNEGDFIDLNNNIPEDLKNIPEPRIVYTGAVYDWFNKELFYDVVKANPDKSFVIIGFGNDKILNEKCDNLFILGPRKHNELKQYLKHCQVGIIPFRDDINLIVNCDPIKQYEYIACGLPIVTTYMPESAIDKINTFLANTKEDFTEAIEKSLKLKIHNSAIENFLIENSWNARAALLCNISDNKINELERYNLIENIENKLEDICNKYNSAIFQTLKAMGLNLKNSFEFEKYVEQAYEHSKYKYIERQYLTALFLNNHIPRLINTINASKNIKNELKEELIYVDKLNDKKLINIILHICVGKINDAIILVNELNDENFKNLYNLYIRFILGKDINFKEILLIGLKAKKSPLYRFLYEEKKIIKKSITILIPTKDRPELLERCVNYFCNMIDEYLDIQIFILDASKSENLKRNKKLENKYKKVVSHFSFDENTSHIFRFIKVYDSILTEFCCLCADDDFLYKEGIIESIEILSKNNDIITVKGKSYIFLNNDTSKIYYFPKDSCLPLIEGDPIERLNKLLSRWVPQIYYVVFRKKDLYKILNIIFQNYDCIANVFTEYLLYFIVPLYGKIVNIEQPLNVRDESTTSQGYLESGFYDYILRGDFNNQYNKFKDILMIACNENNIKIISDDVDNLFKDFLINSWRIPKEYIEVNNSNFEMELLKKGVINAKLK